MATTSAQVQQLYVSLLGRAADQTGLNYWLNQLNTVPASLTLDQLRANIVSSQPEYAAIYGGLSRADTIAKIYVNVFGHTGDPAGLAYWTTGGGSTVAIDQLQVALINGASASDAAAIANKALVADIYTAAAGANFNTTDAATIVAAVKADPTTITDAVGKLSDGSLPSVAIPAAVAAVQAASIAAKAVTDFEAANVSTLTALQKALTDLNAKAVADGTIAAPVALTAITGTNKDGSASYNDASVAIDNATDLRTAISASSTDVLQTNATNTAAALVTAKANLVATGVTADAFIAAYNAAVAANAAVTATSTSNLKAVEGALDATITNITGALAAANAAYKIAVPTATAFTKADDIYGAIKAATTPDAIAKIDAAYGSLANYAPVKAAAVNDAAAAAAAAALVKATANVTTDYADAAKAAAAASTLLADAQAADQLVKQTAAVETGHDSATTAAATAVAAIGTTGAIAHDLDAATPNTAGDIAFAKTDVFFFSALKDADDFAITNFSKGDAIYVGAGYTLNTTATLDSTGHIVGGDNNAKEVFFFKDANAGGVVKAVIETTAGGSANASANLGAAAGDNVAVITLSGIFNLSDVSFANGVITSNHNFAAA